MGERRRGHDLATPHRHHDPSMTGIVHGPVLAFAIGDESYGVMRGWQGVARELRRRGITFHFALVDREGALSRAMLADGVDTSFAPGGAVPGIGRRGIAKAAGMVRRVAAQLRLIRWLGRTIAERHASAILVTSPLEVLMVGIVARRAGIPAYWMMPNGVSDDYPADLNRRLYRFVFRHLNVVPLPNSHYTDATLGPGDFRRQVMHLGIDPVAFDPGAAHGVDRAALGLPDHAIVVGVFARMICDKGQDMLVEALALLGDRAREVHLLLCGGPLDDYADAVRARARAAGIADRVHLPGPIDRNLAGHYAVCDVVANTRLDPEPFGLSVIEAMLMARPVLAHRAGGPRETVVDGVTGWHIDAPTSGSFVAGLARMLDDRVRWDAMGAAGRTRALANFTDERMVDRLLAAMR